jgi:hypothetical protein
LLLTTAQDACFFIIDGNKTFEKVAPNRGLKQGCPLSPFSVLPL